MSDSNPFESIAKAIHGLKRDLHRFIERDGEDDPRELLMRDPLFHAVLSDNEEDAKKYNITDEEGVKAVLDMRIMDQRFIKWFTQRSR